jgi:hypothetical protein
VIDYGKDTSHEHQKEGYSQGFIGDELELFEREIGEKQRQQRGSEVEHAHQDECRGDKYIRVPLELAHSFLITILNQNTQLASRFEINVAYPCRQSVADGVT